LGEETSIIDVQTVRFPRSTVSAHVALANFNCTSSPVIQLNIVAYFTSDGNPNDPWVEHAVPAVATLSNIPNCVAITYQLFLLVGPQAGANSSGLAEGVLTVFLQ